MPCAIVLLARLLEEFRREIDASVFISANGGYRSPAHQIGGAKSIHAWGTAIFEGFPWQEPRIARRSSLSLAGVWWRGFSRSASPLRVFESPSSAELLSPHQTTCS